jgi:hypothetical protein
LSAGNVLRAEPDPARGTTAPGSISDSLPVRRRSIVKPREGSSHFSQIDQPLKELF